MYQDKVSHPAQMNEAFATAFNSRDVNRLLALYQPDAALKVDGTEVMHRGLAQIADVLAGLLQVPGTMVSRNNFCIEQGELALLRADWELLDPAGLRVLAGSSAEVVRRQADGTWLYVIDHAVGSTLPGVAT